MPLVALVPFLLVLRWLVATYQRMTGVWIGPDRRLWWTWVPLVLLVLVPAFVLAEGFGQRWVMVVAGAVLGTAAGVLSRLFTRRWVAELRGER